MKQKYGKLTFLREAGHDKWGSILGEFLCDCGTKIVTRRSTVLKGASRSCGCLTRLRALEKTHGMSKTPEYAVWHNMEQRCRNSKATGYKHYGGRGIKICSAWLTDTTGFTQFLKDVGLRPSKEFSLDRIDTNGDYEPGNVRWATKGTQTRNQRPSHLRTCSDAELLEEVEKRRVAKVGAEEAYLDF